MNARSDDGCAAARIGLHRACGRCPRRHRDRRTDARRRTPPLHYAAANLRCKRLARALLALGVGEGDRVASLAWNTHHHFELFYGVPGIGAVLHTLNPRLHDDTLVFIANHADDRWICVDGATLPIAERLASRLPGVRGWIYMGEAEPPRSSLPGLLSYEALLARQDPGFRWPRLDEWSASTICYTSGTTGRRRVSSIRTVPRCFPPSS